MLAAARLDASIEVPNRITDLASLEQQIRRFIADIGGKPTMALPPADKETRKKIHELAGAFNLNSKSKGTGSMRYTTLTKTTRSGIRTNERKVNAILKRSAGTWGAPGKGKGQNISLAKHREGEEVGKVRFLSVALECQLNQDIRLHRRLGSRTSGSRCWRRWAGRKETELDYQAAWRRL